MTKQTDELRRASMAIYLACEKAVADDVSRILSAAADEIERLQIQVDTMVHRGLHVFSLKRYCVTVMDHWTPFRLFWTRNGALKWRDKIGNHAHAYRWHPDIQQWIEIPRG